MADQIKNENVGEVSSPIEEKVTAPAENESALNTPQDNNAPTDGGAAGESAAESVEEAKDNSVDDAKDDSASEPKKEEKPERKLPTFKNDVVNNGNVGDDNADEAAEEARPARREPVIKEKAPKKLPVFANEAVLNGEQYGDDEDDFTSAAVSMPFSAGSIVNMDTSSFITNQISGHENGKKAKKDKKHKGSKGHDDLSKIDPNSMDNLEDLSTFNSNMPMVDAIGANNYLDLANAMSDPYGVNGYLDLNNSMSKAYVPTYAEENALMSRHPGGSDMDVAEVEPMPESRSSDVKVREEKRSDKREEAEELVKLHKAEKRRRGEEAIARALEKSQMRADELAFLENESYDGYAEDKRNNLLDHITDENDVLEMNSFKQYSKGKKRKILDSGISEAEELLELAAAEKQRRKALKNEDIFSIEARKKFEEEFKAEWGDPGIEEAKELLAVDAAERQKRKEQRRAKRNGEVDATVVEEASTTATYSDDEAQLTGADSEKKKIVILVPGNNGDSSAIGIIAPANADVEAYNVDDYEAAAHLPVELKQISTDAYDDNKSARSERRAEREELAALAAAMKQQKKDEKAFEKANKASAWDRAADTVYGDVDGYYPEEIATESGKAPKAKKEFSPAAYERSKSRKQNKADVAAALVAFYNGNKPVTVKKTKPIKAAPEEIIYPDVDYTEGYDPDWAEKQDAAEAAFKEAKRLERAAAKAEHTDKRNTKVQNRYESHEAKMLLEREQRDALLLTYKEEIQHEKALKAAEKAAKKGVVVPKNDTEVIYDDFTELFDREAYEADKAAEAQAIADAKAEAKALKNAKRDAKDYKKEAKLTSAYDKETAEILENTERVQEMDAFRKQYAAEAKARAKEEKAAEKAEKLAAKNAPKPEVIYEDFTELFDKEAYDAEKAAEAAAVEAVKAEARALKEAKRDEKDAKREAKMSDKYDAAIEKSITKHEKKAELKVLGNESIKEIKDRKAEEKAQEKAEKLAAKNAPKPEVIYDDFTELFDKEAYDAEKAAEAQAIADAKAEAKALKEAKRDEKAEKKEAKIVSEYEKATEYVLDTTERENEMNAFRKQYNAEEKARAKEEKEAEKAAKLAAKNAPKPEVVYEDFTELFDKEAYDAEKAAEAAAVEAVKAEAKALKEAKRDEKDAKREAKMSDKYDAATEKKITKHEKKEELKVLGNESIKENKDRKAEEKAAEKAEKLAKKNAPKPEVIYDDFTELFDKEAYDAEKAAEAQAIADAKAEARALKEAKRDEKDAKREAKMSDKYDAATEKSITKHEKKAELKVLGNESIKEIKDRKAEEKATEKAEKLAAKNAPKPEVIYDDFTELFDKEAYDSEKAAEAAAVEAAKAEAKALKEAKRDEKAEKKDAKLVSAYEKATAYVLDTTEREDAMSAFRKQYNAEEKARAKEEKAVERAEKLAKKNAPKPEVIYDDFTELFDKEAYDAEKAAEAAAVEAVKAEAKALKEAKRDEKDAKREAKMSDKYDAATEKSINKHEKKAELKVLGRDSIKESKERKAAAVAAEKAERLAKANAPKPIPLYSDPELLFNEVDVETKTLIETAPGDVLEGYRPKMVAAADLIRASKEDKQLKLLIKKDRGTVKRVKRELATLELAEKYVDNGSLDLADTKTVVKDAKQFKKDEFEKRLIKDYDSEIASELADEEKIKIAAEDKITRARVKKLEKRAKTYGKNGKFMLEYGSTYDPEWDGEFNHYGLPEIHPYTEGVKLSTTRRRTDKKERFSYFNKKNLSELAKLQCNTDIKMVEARVEYDYIALQLDVAKFEQDYSGEFRSKKEKRWYRDSKEKLKNLKSKIASAKRFEELDNERYYSVVATDFDKVKLPDKADRDELIAMREELMRLLDIRDEINQDLYELYTGTENGMKGSIKGRAKVTLKARKRAHAGYSRFFRVINKRRVTRNEKMRIFDKMDEVVELKGEVAKIKYILKNEKPAGKVKRAYQKELKGAKRDIRILKKAVQRSTIKALRRAKKREVRTWTMIIAYSVLVALSLFTLSMVWFGPEVLRASKEFIFPENMHQYIDFLINNWPF